MTELDGELRPMEGLVDFHEATWVFKRNGLYYLTTPTTIRAKTASANAISKTPLGPWNTRASTWNPRAATPATARGGIQGPMVAFYHNMPSPERGTCDPSASTALSSPRTEASRPWSRQNRCARCGAAPGIRTIGALFIGRKKPFCPKVPRSLARRQPERQPADQKQRDLGL